MFMYVDPVLCLIFHYDMHLATTVGIFSSEELCIAFTCDDVSASWWLPTQFKGFEVLQKEKQMNHYIQLDY